MKYFTRRQSGDMNEYQFIKAERGHAARPANAFAIEVKRCKGDKPDLRFLSALKALMVELGKRGLTGKGNEQGWKIQYGKYKPFGEMKTRDFCCVWANTQRTLANWLEQMVDKNEQLWAMIHEQEVVFKSNDAKAMMLFLFDIFDHNGMSYYDWDERGFDSFELRVIKMLVADLEKGLQDTKP